MTCRQRRLTPGRKSTKSRMFRIVSSRVVRFESDILHGNAVWRKLQIPLTTGGVFNLDSPFIPFSSDSSRNKLIFRRPRDTFLERCQRTNCCVRIPAQYLACILIRIVIIKDINVLISIEWCRTWSMCCHAIDRPISGACTVGVYCLQCRGHHFNVICHIWA